MQQKAIVTAYLYVPVTVLVKHMDILYIFKDYFGLGDL